MTLGLVVLVAVGLRLARGSSLRDLAELKIRGEAVFLCVLVLVVAFPGVAALLRPSRLIVTPVWVLLMGLLLALCLLNRSLGSGFLLAAAGVALNLTVIAANGHMPVSLNAAMSVGGAAAGASVRAGDLFHSAIDNATRLPLLSDILPVPGFPGLRCVLSVGDVLMFVGILAIIVAFTPLRPMLPKGRRDLP